MTYDVLHEKRGVVAVGPCTGRREQSEAERLAQWKPVQMPFHADGLTARERQMVEKLVEASRLLDAVYWRQSDLAGLAIYKSTKNATVRSLFQIMGGRWDLDRSKSPFHGRNADAARA